ncbi:hypothetical protein AXW84_16705 [Hymenobacter sp. PAMC 26628]|nr:hypothetical protein AXW84_16705 [Hymenobacter sp. PAMC 26628]
MLLPLGFGCWFLRLVRASLGLTDEEPVSALTTWLGGVALLTVLLEGWSLLGPLHTGAHLAAAAVGGAGLWQPESRALLRRQWRAARQQPRVVQALGGALALCALAVAAMPPINIDTGYYHAQSVRWLEEMGTVPGLANVELHIGFNSAWFVPEALFSWGRYVGSPLQVLNLVFFVLFGWYGLAGLGPLLRGRAAPSDVVRLLLAGAMLFWVIDDLASLSPDPAVTLLLFFVAVQALRLPPPRPGQPLGTAHAAVMLLSVFALTMKLSTLPVLLLALWWAARSGRLFNGRFVGGMVGLGLAIAGPWLVRNYLLSGYLLFPVAAVDLFHPSWKFPLAELRLHGEYITEYARNSDFYNQISVHGKPWRFWLPLWWRQQFVANKLVLLAIPGLLLVSPALGGWQHRRGRLPQAPQLLAALAVALGGVAFWFLLAPAFRFGYGFLFSALALLLVPVLWPAARHRPRALAGAFAGATGALLLASPLAVEYRHYIIPPALGPAEYRDVQRRLAAPADTAFFRTQYPHLIRTDIWTPGQFVRVFWEKPRRSFAERVRLLWLLGRIGGIKGISGVDGVTGRSGVLTLPRRLVWPAPYPTIAVQALPLPPLVVLQNRQDRIPWYAPFPFAARRRQCAARGPRLADGFRARVVPIGNWRREARW